MLCVFAHHRRGLSLVELLVVVAIFGMVAVTVLPNIAATAESRRSRESARMVSGFVAKAHARALGGREWAGFTIEAVNESSYSAVELSPADVPPVYRGDTVPALLTISRSSGVGTRIATGTNGALLSSGAAGVLAGDLIRFGERDPWFEVRSVTSGTTGSITFGMRGHDDGLVENRGYLPHNTPWPPDAAVTFEVLRQPISSGTPFTLPSGSVIDLNDSGYGPAATASFRRFSDVVGAGNPVSRVAVLFDGAGRLRQMIVTSVATVQRLPVSGPVFLLVGRADRAGQAYSALAGTADDSVGANWQYPDSHWVAIDPASGIAVSAQCKPNATDLIDSQDFVRDSLVMEGR